MNGCSKIKKKSGIRPSVLWDLRSVVERIVSWHVQDKPDRAYHRALMRSADLPSVECWNFLVLALPNLVAWPS